MGKWGSLGTTFYYFGLPKKGIHNTFPMRDKYVTIKYVRLLRQEALVWEFSQTIFIYRPKSLYCQQGIFKKIVTQTLLAKLLARQTSAEAEQVTIREYWTVRRKLFFHLYSESVTWDNNNIDYKADYVDNSWKHFFIPTVVYVPSASTAYAYILYIYFKHSQNIGICVDSQSPAVSACNFL